MFYSSRSLRFRLRGLPEGIHPFDCEIPPESLDIPDAIAPISVRGELRSDVYFHFKMTISSLQRHQCDRCTDDFEATYSVPLDVVFVAAGKEEGLEDSGYLHLFDPMHLGDVDLTEDVRDALLLAMPMKKLCKPDCKGILRDEPAEEDIVEYDPRFASLGAVYEKLRSDEATKDQ